MNNITIPLSILLTLSIFMMSFGLSYISNANNSDTHYTMMEDIYKLHEKEPVDLSALKQITKSQREDGGVFLILGYVSLAICVVISPINKIFTKK